MDINRDILLELKERIKLSSGYEYEYEAGEGTEFGKPYLLRLPPSVSANYSIIKSHTIDDKIKIVGVANKISLIPGNSDEFSGCLGVRLFDLTYYPSVNCNQYVGQIQVIDATGDAQEAIEFVQCLATFSKTYMPEEYDREQELHTRLGHLTNDIDNSLVVAMAGANIKDEYEELEADAELRELNLIREDYFLYGFQKLYSSILYYVLYSDNKFKSEILKIPLPYIEGYELTRSYIIVQVRESMTGDITYHVGKSVQSTDDEFPYVVSFPKEEQFDSQKHLISAVIDHIKSDILRLKDIINSK